MTLLRWCWLDLFSPMTQIFPRFMSGEVSLQSIDPIICLEHIAREAASFYYYTGCTMLLGRSL